MSFGRNIEDFTDIAKFFSHITVRGRKILRRSEPSSRTALIGEQPNPWDLSVVISRFREDQTIPSPS